MAGIPLPALDVRPPQAPPNQLEQLGQILGLRNAIQEAPLRQQALQQQVQSGGLQVQQQQQALKDQQAVTAAMSQWDGKDINSLEPLVLKNGGSGMAVIGLKQKSLAMQQQYSQIAKNDADAGTANLKALQTKGDLISGALSPLIDPTQTPDAALPQALTATAQGLVQRGLLDPQHAQQAAQLAQSGNPEQIRQQLDLMRKSFMAQSQIMDAAQKQAQTQEAQANTQKTQAETNFYKQNGGAPGVPPAAMEMADWLKKNPGKGPADFYTWQQHQNPWLQMMNENFLGGGQNGATSPGLDLAAQNYLLTGQMPAGLYRSVGTTQAIINRAAQMNQQSGGSGIAANKAVLLANEGSLKNLQKNYDQVQAFEQTAEKNMDLLQQTAKSIPDLSGRFANVPVRMFNAKMLGTANMAKFQTALYTAQSEAAKVLNSSNATGVLSDSSRHELQQIIDGNVSYKALVGSLDTLKQDMNNRTQSYQLQIGDIQKRIKGAGSATPLPAPGADGKTDPFAQFGGAAH